MSNGAHNPADLLVISRKDLEAFAQEVRSLDARLHAAETRIEALQQQINELKEIINRLGGSHGENT